MNGIRYLLEHPESGIRVGGLMMPEAGKDEIYGRWRSLRKSGMFLFFMPKREIYGITFREKEVSRWMPVAGWRNRVHGPE